MFRGMCGRYVSPAEAAIERAFDLRGAKGDRFIRKGLSEAFEGNYNTSPTQQVPIIRQRDVIRVVEGGERELVTMRWGLIPHFAHGDAGPYSTFNARMETVRSSPAYRGAWKKSQRCLVPAAGFYEWQAQLPDLKKAIPHLITVTDQEVFAMAGLWDESTTPDGEVILSCTVITMPANELMREVHNSRSRGGKRVLLPEDQRRMPAILAKEDQEVWLRGSAEEAWAVLKPYPSARMRAVPVASPKAGQPPQLL